MKNWFDIAECYKIVWYCASSSVNVWRLNFNLCDMAHVMLIITIHSSPFTTFQENWTQWQCCWWSEKYLIISFSWVFSWIKIRHIARRFDLRKKLFSHLLKMAFSNFFFGWLETERRCLWISHIKNSSFPLRYLVRSSRSYFTRQLHLSDWIIFP